MMCRVTVGVSDRRLAREDRMPTPNNQPSRWSAARDREEPAITQRHPLPKPVAPSSRDVYKSGRKWRDSIAPTAGTTRPPVLPDLPDEEPSGGRRRSGNGRRRIVGLGLAAFLALVVLLAASPLGPDGTQHVLPPTPRATVPPARTEASSSDRDRWQDTTYVIEHPQPSEGQAIVCIDPGHGGWDTGWKRDRAPVVTESSLALSMAYLLKAELEAEGIFVVLTRPSGVAVNAFAEDINQDGETQLDAETPDQAAERDELQARINVCNEAGADVLISVHVNGFDDETVRGYEVFYTAEREFGDQNEELATLVYRELDTALRDTDMADHGRGARPDSEADIVRHEYGTADNYIMTGPAVVVASIEPSRMPGIIVEAAFLSNDQDAAWIVQPANQQIMAEAYRDGILAYFDRNPPDTD